MGAALIPGWPATLAAFGLAAGFCTLIGLPLARLVAPRGVPALGLAPALGWAAYMATAVPMLALTGFGAGQVAVTALAAAAPAAWAWRRTRASPDAPLPQWVPGLAAAMAWLPAMAIMPKAVGSGVLLAPPMFDHVKVALVDSILRTGLPVANPFYGPEGRGHLAYYYLWHFGTAMLGSVLHGGGWSAEAAMTGFTAFASLMLMAGLVAALGGRRLATLAALGLTLSGSMRPLLAAVLGADGASRVIPGGSDIGGWLNQAAWVPQHLASASCMILSGLLMLRLAEAGGPLVAVALGLTVAAGFESSAWVGGITFAAAGTALGLKLLWQLPRSRRRAFLLWGSAAAGLAAVLIAPFAFAELRAMAARSGGAGIALAPSHVFGSLVAAGLRPVLDLPAFWLVLLPFSLPGIVPLGLAAIARPNLAGAGHDRRRLTTSLAVLALACLAVSWLFRSTIDNNDLGWRAALPAVLLLAVFAGCGLARLVRASRLGVAGAALAFACLGLPQTWDMLRGYARGQLPGDAAGFAQSESLWQAVRRHAAPTDRVGSNPLLVQRATPWPVNISWALLSDRPSCFGGWEVVIAYAALSRPRLEEISDRFERVFAGVARPGDVAALAEEDGCQVIAVSRGDAAWARDPFGVSADYRLVESGESWRIYTRTGSEDRPGAGK